MRAIPSFKSEQSGAALAEFALAIPIVVIFVFAALDFSVLFWQWNMAIKAVERGARLAAVSDPVASGLKSINTVLTAAGAPYPVDAFPKITCDGLTATCTGPQGISFDQAALNTIVYGRGSNACGDAVNLNSLGMCDLFRPIKPENVVVEYRQSGLGFQGRPGGPIPSITVRLKNVPFSFTFVDRLLGFNTLTMINASVTITGEDLSSHGP